MDSWIPTSRSGYVVRRGRRKPLPPSEALQQTADHVERLRGGDTDAPAELLALWALCRGAWAMDIAPVFIDGVGRLFDAPERIDEKRQAEWQKSVSVAVAASCRAQKPELLLDDESLATVEEVRHGILALIDATLDEVAAQSVELEWESTGRVKSDDDGDEFAKRQAQWRRRWASALAW